MARRRPQSLAAKSSGSFCSARRQHLRPDNNETIDSTWPYSDNQGSSADGQILEGGFVEGGINLSSIYEGLGKELPWSTGSSLRRKFAPRHGRARGLRRRSFNVCSKLIVDKVTPSGDQTRFPFSVSGPAALRLVPARQCRHAPRQRPDQAGTYQVTETPAMHVWNAPSVAARTRANDVSYGANGAVAIAPGATVTCTFTNTKKPQLTVVKKIVGGNGTTDAFDVKVDGRRRSTTRTSTLPRERAQGRSRFRPARTPYRDARRRLPAVSAPVGT